MKKVEKQILILLAMAQLILTLDSTVMNVSISTLVKDLGTTVAGVQSAITFYSLVMAAFMLAGAKIGDIIGRKKAFIIGLVIYGTGSAITALAPNIVVLKFGWSLLEGLGAALIIPAMISLVASNFTDKQSRIKAYGTVAAMAAIGAGVGPIVGGLLTTYASWRYVFAGEVVIVVYILLRQRIIVDAKFNGKKPKLDWVGMGLSATGMAVIVQGILMASTYGLFRTRQVYSFLGTKVFEVGSVSPTVVFVTTGLVILGLFVAWELYRTKKAKDVLVHLQLFMNQVVSSGAGSIFATQFLLAGVLYSLALYLQLELGYDAFKTGVVMLPLSLMVLVAASRGSIMATKFAPRRIVQTGFVLTILGVAGIGLVSRNLQNTWQLVPSLILVGAGVGIIFSQLQNLVQSAVSEQESAEASGVMATFQYLGASFGTAMSGVLLVGALLLTSSTLIAQNTTLNANQKDQLNAAYESQAQIMSDAQIQAVVAEQPAEVSQTVVTINAEARQKSLTATFILLAVISLLGLLATIKLPANKPGPRAFG